MASEPKLTAAFLRLMKVKILPSRGYKHLFWSVVQSISCHKVSFKAFWWQKSNQGAYGSPLCTDQFSCSHRRNWSKRKDYEVTEEPVLVCHSPAKLTMQNKIQSRDSHLFVHSLLHTDNACPISGFPMVWCRCPFHIITARGATFPMQRLCLSAAQICDSNTFEMHTS